MHCLVTGAAGFIGSTLSDMLLAQGHSVLGVDCFVDYYPRAVKESNIAAARTHPRYSFQEVNLLQADMSALLHGVDWVFHQAAQAGVRASWGSYFDTYCQNNILATQRLLETTRGLLAQPGATLKKIVYASSSSVYGNAESLPTSEDLRPQPVSPYGVTKLAAEHLMCLYATEFAVPTVSLRYFTVFGPRQRPEMAFHKFISAALQGQPLVVYGDGHQSRDFTFVQDIAAANMLAAERGKPGAVYNIGGGTQASVRQVLSMLEEFIGPINVRFEERQSGDAKHTSADTTRARAELGFKPLYSLQEGLQAQIAWLRTLKV